jgi:hypothetical protein
VTSLVDVLIEGVNQSLLHLLCISRFCCKTTASDSLDMRSFAIALPALVTAYVAYAPSEGAGVLQNGALQNILKNTDKTDKYRYPTDFTRGIEPVSP